MVHLPGYERPSLQFPQRKSPITDVTQIRILHTTRSRESAPFARSEFSACSRWLWGTLPAIDHRRKTLQVDRLLVRNR